MKRVSDIVKSSDMRSWNKGETIIIKAPTGTGKSYLIKNVLYNLVFANSNAFDDEKILFLVNRSRLKEQFQLEITKDNKDDFIDVKTYQWLEKLTLYDPVTKVLTFDDKLGEYSHIVCDEFHYFVSDAAFNNKTDLSLYTILNSERHIKIFMSATTNTIITFMKQKKVKTKDYIMEREHDYIDKLYFSYKDSVIEKYISQVPDNEKIIYFTRSAKRGYEMSLAFNNSLFVCSQSNKTYKQYLDNVKITEMLINELFEEKMLLATTTLDNGVNIRDESIKHIIVDIEDIDIMMQCIGRKRSVDYKDKYTLIIKTMNNNQIGGRITQLKKKIAMAEYLELGNTTARFVKKYPRENYGKLIYDYPNKDGSAIKVVNDVMLFKYRYDIDLLENHLKYKKEKKEDKKTGYIVHVLGELKKDFQILEDTYDEMNIKDYLNKLLGVKMFKEEQSKFKKWLDENLLNSPKADHGSIGLKTINGFFDDNNYEYNVVSERENKGNDRNKRFWIVKKY